MSQSPNTDPEIPEKSAVEPPSAGIILVQPQDTPYGLLIRGALADLLTGEVERVHALFGKANSDMIAAADQGPFSHSVLYSGDVAVDSRSGGRHAAVGSDSVGKLKGHGRSLSFYGYDGPDGPSEPGEPPDDGPARAVEAVLEFIRRTGAETGVPISDEVNRFPVAAMVNLGLILVSSQRKGLRWLARFLTRQAADAEGMYCAELVAKAMDAADAPFVVRIDRSRIPEPGSRAEMAVNDAIQRRLRVWNSFSFTQEADTPAPADYPIDRLRALHASLSAAESDSTQTRRVGLDDDEFPPFLVSPNDLARSPSFRWSVNHPVTDPKPPPQQAASLLRVLALGAIVYVTRWYVNRKNTPRTLPHTSGTGSAT